MDLVLLGGGTLARFAVDIAVRMGITPVGVYDDCYPASLKGLDLQVLGKMADLPKGATVAICVGEPEVRRDLLGRCQSKKCVLPPLIDPSAVISAGAHIGQGTIIGPLSSVLEGSTIGDGACILSHVNINQDVNVGACALIAAGVVVGNNARIDDLAHPPMRFVVPRNGRFRMDRRISREFFSLQVEDMLSNGVPKWECHVHTSFTDGAAGVRACVDHAESLGLDRLIFTEHCESWKAASPDFWPEFFGQVAAEKQRCLGKLEVFAGIETPALDFEGNVEIPPIALDMADFVLGTAHRYPDLDGVRVRDLEHRVAVDLEYKTLMGLARSPHIDAIAHIGGTCRLYTGSFPQDLMHDVVKEAAQNGIPIEINSKYHNPVDGLANICLELGSRITIGSDAHAPAEIGRSSLELSRWRESRIS